MAAEKYKERRSVKIKDYTLISRIQMFTEQLKSNLHAMRKLSSLADQVLVSGGNFLTMAVCAHTLPLSEQGKFTYVFASYMILLLMNVAGIFQGAAVRAPTQDNNSYRILLARWQVLQALLLSMLLSAGWLGAGKEFGWNATASEWGLLLGFLIVQQLADFDRRSAYIFTSTRRAVFSSAALYPVRAIWLIIASPQTVSQVLVILIVSAIIPALLTLAVMGRTRTECTQSWVAATKAHLTYSRWFIAGAPLGWLWSYIPIFMLGTMHGKEQAALLASIRGISNIANVLMEQIETKVVADWARMNHENGVRTVEPAVMRLLKIGTTFWLLGLTIIVIWGKLIVALVLGSLYAPHWHLLVVGWVGYGVYFYARVFGIKHRTLGSTRIEFAGNVGGVMAAMLAGLVTIPLYGAMGAAWVYVIIAGVMLASQLLTYKKWKED